MTPEYPNIALEPKAHICDCGRSLGKAQPGPIITYVLCPCGRHMGICDLQVVVENKRRSFVMSTGESQ